MRSFLGVLLVMAVLGCGDFVFSPEEARQGKLDQCDDIEQQIPRSGSHLAQRSLEAEWDRLHCGDYADEQHPSNEDDLE